MPTFDKLAPFSVKQYRFVRKSDKKVSCEYWTHYPTQYINHNLNSNWRDIYDVVLYVYDGTDSKIVTR